MSNMRYLSDEDLETEAWLAEGMELIRKWDSGDRSPEVVAFIEHEGIVERRELERNRTPEEREQIEQAYQDWLWSE